MAQQHIVKAFDEQLNQLDAKIAEMGGLAESMLADAIDALSKRDAELAAEVVGSDHKLDALENDVNNLALRLLALRQPMAEDLRTVLAALKISSDLERAGDLAKNIAKRTVILARHPSMATPQDMGALGASAQKAVRDVMDSFTTRDAAKAEAVWQHDYEVDDLVARVMRQVISRMSQDMIKAKVKIGSRAGKNPCAVALAFVDRLTKDYVVDGKLICKGLTEKTATNVYLPAFKDAVNNGKKLEKWNIYRDGKPSEKKKGSAKGKGKSTLSNLLVKAFNHDDGKSFEELCSKVESQFEDAKFDTVYECFIDYLKSEGFEIKD